MPIMSITRRVFDALVLADVTWSHINYEFRRYQSHIILHGVDFHSPLRVRDILNMSKFCGSDALGVSFIIIKLSVISIK